jgi:hypothetical protein
MSIKDIIREAIHKAAAEERGQDPRVAEDKMESIIRARLKTEFATLQDLFDRKKNLIQ